VPELGLVPDGAYWVDEITPRRRVATPDGDAEVDLVSHACPSWASRDVVVTPDAGLTPVPWIGQGASVASERPTDGARRITGSLRNVASVLIDVDRACVGAARVVLDIEVDGPTVVRFSDGRPSVALRPLP
jgi:hypothetical protein